MLTRSRIGSAPVYAVLAATDIERARRFYERTLGLEVEPAPSAGGFFVMAGKDTRFLVYETTAPHGANTVAAFIVDDVAASVEELRGHGVVFEEYDLPGLKTVDGIAEFGSTGRGAWFMDSEGNTLNIAEM